LYDLYRQKTTLLGIFGATIMSAIENKPAPKGFKWVFCRYRKVKNSQKVLDAHEYGHEAWRFLVRC